PGDNDGTRPASRPSPEGGVSVRPRPMGLSPLGTRARPADDGGMDGRSASGSGSDRLASALAPFGAEAVAIARLVVPLDGSPFAERALPVARWAAGALAADVQVVEVVPARDDEAAEAAIRYLDAVAHRHRATSWDVLRGDDVARALAD